MRHLKEKKRAKFKKVYFEPPNPLNYPVVDKEGEPINNNKKDMEKEKITLDYHGREVKGYFIIMKTGSYFQPGIRLFRNRRLIKGSIVEPNRPGILLGTKNKYASERLYGELHLDDFKIDFMKTKFKEKS